jgi:hypothetical protein
VCKRRATPQEKEQGLNPELPDYVNYKHISQIGYLRYPLTVDYTVTVTVCVKLSKLSLHTHVKKFVTNYLSQSAWGSSKNRGIRLRIAQKRPPVRMTAEMRFSKEYRVISDTVLASTTRKTPRIRNMCAPIINVTIGICVIHLAAEAEVVREVENWISRKFAPRAVHWIPVWKK